MADELSVQQPPLVIGEDLTAWSVRLQTMESGESIESDELVEQPTFENGVTTETVPTPRRNFASSIRVSLLPDGDAARWLRTKLHAGENVLLELFLEGSLVVDGFTATFSDASDATIVEARRGLPGEGVPICRDAAQIGGLSGLPPRSFLPQVYGRNDLRPVPLFPIENAMMLEDVVEASSAIRLQAPVAWPPRGRVQVQDEVMEYASISPDGEVLQGLIRTNPRSHGRGARVVLLPLLGTLDWCFADHNATLAAVRVESSDGPPLTGHTVATRLIGGRSAMVIRRDVLPVRVGESLHAVDRETARARRYWRILPRNSAYDPMDAFTERSPDRGAVMDRHSPALLASFRLPLAENRARFDRLAALTLSLEFSESAGWTSATRLLVRATRGIHSVVRQINRDGSQQAMTLQGRAISGAQSAAVVSPETLRLHFDRIDSSGEWANAEAAIDGRFQARAISASDGALVARFFVPRPEAARHAVRFRLHARVRNGGGEHASVRLECSVPLLLYRQNEHGIGPGETDTMTLESDLPSNVSTGQLLADNARFRLLASRAGVEVEELWLELLVTPSAHALTGAAGTFSIQAQGVFPVIYHRVEIDVSLLLQGADPWEVLSSEDDPVTLLIEILNAPDMPLWSVALRDVHWRMRVFPVTSVRPTTELRATVNGRHTRFDGTANAALVVRELLLSNAGLGTSAIDAASFTAAVSVMQSRGIGFAAVYTDDSALGGVISRALGESTLSLVRAAGRWRLDADELSPARTLLPEFPRTDIYEGASEILQVAAAPRDRDAVAWRWLATGEAVLRRWIEARVHPRRAESAFDADAAWMMLRPATAVALAPHRDPSRRYHGELQAVSYREGRVHATLQHATPVELLFSAGDGAILRNDRHGELVFLWQGRAVAVLSHAGRFTIRGIVREGALEPVTALTVFIVSPSQQHLRASFQPDAGAAASFAITAAGDLLTTVPIAEDQSFADGAPNGAGEMRVDATVIGGAPGGLAALRLDATTLRLRGRIISNSTL